MSNITWTGTHVPLVIELAVEWHKYRRSAYHSSCVELLSCIRVYVCSPRDEVELLVIVVVNAVFSLQAFQVVCFFADLISLEYCIAELRSLDA